MEWTILNVQHVILLVLLKSLICLILHLIAGNSASTSSSNTQFAAVLVLIKMTKTDHVWNPLSLSFWHRESDSKNVFVSQKMKECEDMRRDTVHVLTCEIELLQATQLCSYMTIQDIWCLWRTDLYRRRAPEPAEWTQCPLEENQEEIYSESTSLKIRLQVQLTPYNL